MLEGIESLKVQTVIASTPAMAVRIARGQIQSAEDVIALRKVSGLTQKQFAGAMGISVHTLRNWEQGRRSPEGPALALLRIAARHPHILQDGAAEPAVGPAEWEPATAAPLS
jgi:DNA-binding transcriptional regulator YiaG